MSDPGQPATPGRPGRPGRRPGVAWTGRRALAEAAVLDGAATLLREAARRLAELAGEAPRATNEGR